VVAPSAPIADWTFAFEVLLVACGALMLLSTWVTLGRLRVSEARRAVAVLLVGASPLLLGSVVLSRFDLVPAALVALAMAAVSIGRLRLSGVVLALAVGVKLYPAFLVVPLLILAWRSVGRREAIVVGAVTVLTLFVTSVPFLLADPAGMFGPLSHQLDRPLQVESLGAAVLLVAHHLTGLAIVIETSFGSQNIVSDPAPLLRTATGLAQIVVILAIWVWFARGRGTLGRFTQTVAATLVAVVAFDHAISPQYMLWLVPVVPLVPGRRGILAMAGLAGALVLTHGWFPTRYFEMIGLQDAVLPWLLLARDLLLVAMVGVLMAPRALVRWVGVAWARLTAPTTRDRVIGWLPGPATAMVLLVGASALLRLLWLDTPSGALIFDETYYVNAARVILGMPLPEGAPYMDAAQFLDPNIEHPPLGKAIMALSMSFLGDGAMGWRLPSVIAGCLTIVATFGIVRALGGSGWLAVVTAAFLSLDPLSFIHGRVGVLDGLMVGCLLTAAWLALRDRWVLAGAVIAAAVLIKITAVFGVVAIIGMVLLRPGVPRAERLGPPMLIGPLRMLGTFTGVALGGLWLLDLRYTTFRDPLQHIAHMLTYGFALRDRFSVDPISSSPFDWLLGKGQIDYLAVNENLMVDGEIVGSHPLVLFRAIIGPVLLGGATLAIPYAWWRARRRADPLATWGLVWVTAMYVPFLLLWAVAGRISYLYYALPVIPGLAVLFAVLLRRSRLPRIVTVTCLAAAVVVFIAVFPIRQLP
jgi:predicted membrane-bound dolichyl-phosphate-mannose-protein mannosyltransferase